MEIIFVRHGETQHNKKHQLMGQRIDDKLDEEGLHQASELFAKLPKTADVIFSSSLKRALQTAEILSKHLNVRVQVSELLRERDFGDLSGKSWDQIEKETAVDMHSIDQSLHYDYRPYGGESVDQVKTRLKTFLDVVKRIHEDETVIVVTHYGLIMLMDSLYPDKKTHGLGNVSVHKYKI